MSRNLFFCAQIRNIDFRDFTQVGFFVLCRALEAVEAPGVCLGARTTGHEGQLGGEGITPRRPCVPPCVPAYPLSSVSTRQPVFRAKKKPVHLTGFSGC
jgi:hypothetical protein